MGKILKKDANIVQLEKEISAIESNINKQERKLKELADDLKMANLFDDEVEVDMLKSMRDDVLDEIAILEKELAEKEEEYEAL